MIVVFAGAGASKAVEPERYPTTIEFFERLPSEVTADDIFQHAVAFLKEKHPNVVQLDIEQVLWLAAELRDFTSRASDTASVPGWFIEGNRLSTIAKRGDNVTPLHAVASAATRRVDGLVSRINALVYDLYGEPPSKPELEKNWIPLLKELPSFGQTLELVTTNYDIVLEEAIVSAKAPVLTGRTTGNQPTLDLTMWDLRGLNAESFSAYGRLTKLHGSVDWARGRDRIFVGTPLFQGRHERHAIIYPGFKGTPTDPLFQQLHRYFQERVSQAEVLIFIGYAFRDEYINNVLEREVRRQSHVIVVNPSERLPGLPFPESRVSHIRAAFNEESVKAILNGVRKVIGQEAAGT